MRKSSAVRRDWSSAEKKRNRCRIRNEHGQACPGWPVELAHTISRDAQDAEHLGARGGRYLFVHPDSVVPLCTEHHQLYDARRLDLLPYLTIDEQHNALDAAGGLELARKRLMGSAL